MSKKKIMVLVTSALLTLGVIGGTLATFTSKDEVTNKFQTIQDTDNKKDAGIDIWEKFDKDKSQKAMPGVVVGKVVQVQNTALYSQLIKVKLTPTWVGDAPKDDNGNAIAVENAVIMTLSDDVADEAEVTAKLTDLQNTNPNATTVDAIGELGRHWIKSASEANTYYYAGRVSSKDFTSVLLESVTLDSAVGNNYKNVQFDVRVDASSTLSNIKYSDGWEILNDFTDADNFDAQDPGLNDNDSSSDGTKATGNETIGNKLQ